MTTTTDRPTVIESLKPVALPSFVPTFEVTDQMGFLTFEAYRHIVLSKEAETAQRRSL